MPLKRNWKIRIDDICDAIRKITEFTQGMNFDSFCKDEKTIDAVIRNFEVIGEAARQVPDEIQKNHPHIPWEEMKGMRNILIHEYFGISTEMVWETIQKDLPQLFKKLKPLTKL